MQEVKMVFKNGEAEITVNGVKGNACKTLTADFEQHLGKVTSSMPTKEAYEREVNTAQNSA